MLLLPCIREWNSHLRHTEQLFQDITVYWEIYLFCLPDHTFAIPLKNVCVLTANR